MPITIQAVSKEAFAKWLDDHKKKQAESAGPAQLASTAAER
jgi:heme/copper-type cytochrome/quinol oxidase subunit 2